MIDLSPFWRRQPAGKAMTYDTRDLIAHADGIVLRGSRT